MHLLALFIAFAAILVLLFNSATALACKFLRVGVLEFRVFVGPTLMRWQVGGCDASVALFPISGYVKPDPEILQTRSLAARLLMSLSGLAGVACLGFALLGGAGFLHYVQRTFVCLLSGALHPATVGVHSVARLAQVAMHSFGEGLGVLAAANVAFGLLPMPTTPMYRMLAEICGRDLYNSEGSKLETAGAILLFALHAVWFVAVAMFFYQPLA